MELGSIRARRCLGGERRMRSRGTEDEAATRGQSPSRYGGDQQASAWKESAGAPGGQICFGVQAEADRVQVICGTDGVPYLPPIGAELLQARKPSQVDLEPGVGRNVQFDQGVSESVDGLMIRSCPRQNGEPLELQARDEIEISFLVPMRVVKDEPGDAPLAHLPLVGFGPRPDDVCLEPGGCRSNNDHSAGP